LHARFESSLDSFAKAILNSFLIALEVLDDLDVGVFPYAALIFFHEFEILANIQPIVRSRVPQIGILVRIAAQVVDHRKLRLDVGTLDERDYQSCSGIPSIFPIRTL